jgi:siroheme synthase
VAVVRNAGAPEQRVWRSTLGRVAADTAGSELSPCIVVVGAVAGLQWGSAAADGAAAAAAAGAGGADAGLTQRGAGGGSGS